MGFFDFLDPSNLLGGLTGSGNSDAAKYLADRQYEIADRVQRREDRLFNIWREHYRACELKLKDEICSLPVFTLFPRENGQIAQFDVQTAFWRTATDIEDRVQQTCGKLTCSNDTYIAVARAGIMAWASNAVIRADEVLLPVRRQHRYEELSRLAAFGHKVYFNTRGAEMAIGVYGQASAMALRQQNNTASALGYFLQRVVSYGADSGWFGATQSGQQSLGAASLSGQDTAPAASMNNVSMPAMTSSTPVAPQVDNSLGGGGGMNMNTNNLYGAG